MAADRNRTTLQQFYTAFNQHDIEAIAPCIADDIAVPHGEPLGLGHGREAYLKFVSLWFEAFPDMHTEVLQMVAEDNLVAIRLRNTGTHEGEFMGIPATGRRFDLEVGHFSRHNDDGEIIEELPYFDQLAFLQQLGVIPEDALA